MGSLLHRSDLPILPWMDDVLSYAQYVQEHAPLHFRIAGTCTVVVHFVPSRRMDDDNCFQPNSFLFGFKYYYFNEFLEFLRIVRDV
jgi:hypothetical protein